MTVSELENWAVSMSHPNTDRDKYKAIKDILAKVSQVKDYISEKDAVNQAVTNLSSVWETSYKVTRDPKFLKYIEVSKLATNKMMPLYELEQKIGDIKFDDLESLVDYIKKAAWGVTVDYQTTKDAFEIREISGWN